MGTAGNRPGFKVYSISTTIRNPRRNTEFLEVLVDFDKKELTSEIKSKIEAFFENSTLPYEVDVIDLNNITDKFKQHIINDLVEI